MKKWKLLKSEKLFNSKWISLSKNSYEINGKIFDDYYHIDRPDYVLIVAVNEKKEIIIERQYRRGIDEIMLELPSGWIDEGENPVQAAERELQEETGYKGKGEQIGVLKAQPGFMSMKAYVILIRIDKEMGDKSLSSDEIIETFKLPIDKITEMIKNGEITDMNFVSAINLYMIKKKIIL